MTGFDSQKIAHAFTQAAATYDQVSVLQREIGNRLFERLELIRIQPQSILDLGSGTGYFTRLLEKRYPKAAIYGVDNAVGMLQFASKKTPWFTQEHFVAGNMVCLPFLDNTFDFIFSNLALHWSSNFELAFKEIHRLLKPGGFLIFSITGVDTLKELHHSWSQVDDYPHINPFFEMHDVGDLLLQLNFHDPVMDLEQLTLHYSNFEKLVNDLRMLGAHNNFPEKRKTLTGKNRFKKMLEAYEQYREEGRLPATYEIIYGHAWQKLVSDVPSEQGQIKISIDQIRSL